MSDHLPEMKSVSEKKLDPLIFGGLEVTLKSSHDFTNVFPSVGHVF